MDWTAVIKRARTVAEVLDVIDEFTSSMTDDYWRAVPQALRRPVIVAEVDLERWHHGLVKQLAETNAPGKPLQELARVSLHAVARVHQIRLRLDPRDETNEGKASALPLRRPPWDPTARLPSSRK